jgi:hypothetical protein
MPAACRVFNRTGVVRHEHPLYVSCRNGSSYGHNRFALRGQNRNIDRPRFPMALVIGRRRDLCGSRSVIEENSMRLLIALTVLMVSGCLKQTVREPKPADTSNEGKSEIRELEDRLGV